MSEAPRTATGETDIYGQHLRKVLEHVRQLPASEQRSARIRHGDAPDLAIDDAERLAAAMWNAREARSPRGPNSEPVFWEQAVARYRWPGSSREIREMLDEAALVLALLDARPAEPGTGDTERAETVPEAEWPVVTAWVALPIHGNGANPVALGVGREGEQVGYYSGGRMPADRSEVELWLRLDPAALAALPKVEAALRREWEEERNEHAARQARIGLTWQERALKAEAARARDAEEIQRLKDEVATLAEAGAAETGEKLDHVSAASYAYRRLERKYGERGRALTTAVEALEEIARFEHVNAADSVVNALGRRAREALAALGRAPGTGRREG